MKKVIAIFGALAISAGMSFAQNNQSSVSQSGDDHAASIEQIGMQNQSIVNQTDGGGNSTGNADASVTQHGNENSVNLSQNAFFGQFFGDSEATILQIGDRNTVRGVNEEDAFSQSNVGGIVDVRMEGNDNLLYSLRGEAQKNGNYFGLDIMGDLNNVGMEQEFGEAEVKITGNSNEVTVSQMAGANWNESQYNEAGFFIDGDNNEGHIDQDGLANKASQWVSGDDNSVVQDQLGNNNHQRVEITGSNNDFAVDQMGDGNRTYVNARGTGPGGNNLESHDSDFTATQYGEDNIITGAMGGSNNSLDISQTGDGNMVTGGMGMWDAAGFTIEGNNNNATITQQSDGNAAVLNVMGNNNTSTITQN